MFQSKQAQRSQNTGMNDSNINGATFYGLHAAQRTLLVVRAIKLKRRVNWNVITFPGFIRV